jgi:TolA-binding protein
LQDDMATIAEQSKHHEETTTWHGVSLRTIYIVGGALVLIALVIWGITVSGRRKAEYSARELDQARAVAESGNLPLASSSLQKVIQSYPGTPAAEEAVITLNQVRLVNGQNELAAVNLRDYLKSSHDPQYVAAANGLLGAALENSRRPLEAAAAYRAAAAATGVDYLKAEYLVDAGRAYRDAGKTTEAAGAYREVIDKYAKTASVTEAQVRLAELTDGKM